MIPNADSNTLPLVRRSNLLVPLVGNWEEQVEKAWHYDPDAITLDLEDFVLPSRKPEARATLSTAINVTSKVGSDIFVRVNKPYLKADLLESVKREVTGILLPKVESPTDVRDASESIKTVEESLGIDIGHTQIIVLIESALGVWNIRHILRSSTRISQVALIEGNLSYDLGIYATGNYDPFEYARGRIIVEAIASKTQPIGMTYSLGRHPLILKPSDFKKLACESKNLGFKGMLCPHYSWISPVNEAFTPTNEEVTYQTKVRRVFAEAVAAGTAAVPLDGRMIDVPVDERAKDILNLAQACHLRDEQKTRLRTASLSSR